ncbi:MAG: DUF4249 family protein [Bacteroidota bacterium]|jgi:hypothetical protein
MKRVQYIILGLISSILLSCEKEIDVSRPGSKEQLIVEASINQLVSNLNYVYVTKSLDYFKPDLTVGGVKDANVIITEGRISGTDTIYDGPATQFFNIYGIPGADSIILNFFNNPLIDNLAGIYVNPAFTGKESTPYALEVSLPDGRLVTGKTFIPKVIRLDTIKYEVRGEPDDSGRYDAFVNFYWQDPPERNNYRLAFIKGSFGNLLLGWGAAENFRTFDDEFLNDQYRSYSFFRPFKTTDTLNLYFSQIGRKEFLFWQSYSRANNSGNPFSTPVILKSNITGAIGTFAGYAVDYRQLIIK